MPLAPQTKWKAKFVTAYARSSLRADECRVEECLEISGIYQARENELLMLLLLLLLLLMRLLGLAIVKMFLRPVEDMVA